MPSLPALAVPHAGEILAVGGGLADLLRPYVPERLRFVVDQLVSPGLTILLILVLASVLVRLARRGIGRVVARAKDPDGSRTARLRSRIGLVEPDEQDLRRAQRADALGAVARSGAATVVWGVAAMLVLAQVGVHVGPLIAGAGIVGIAVGFGAQDLVKDFLSGMFMLLEDQYGVGDVIDVGTASGVVEGISLRSTRIRAVDGTLWHLPNGEIRRVGNMSKEFAVAVLDVGVSREVDRAMALVGQVAAAAVRVEPFAGVVLGVPEVLGVQRLGDGAVDLRVQVRTLPGRQWDVARELRHRLKAAFDAADAADPVEGRPAWLRAESRDGGR